MSITRTESFPCPCGELLTVDLVDSLNADRHPLLRKMVIDRQLHVARCEKCERSIVVETSFLYVDLGRRQVLGVFGRNDRGDADACARIHQDTFERWFVQEAPEWIKRLSQKCLVRVCFGLEELREKLVADEAGIDDYALEALKCVLLAQDPRFRKDEVATLRLDRVDGKVLELLTVDFDDLPLGRRVRVRRDELDQLPLAALRAAFPKLAVGPHVSVLRLGLR